MQTIIDKNMEIMSMEKIKLHFQTNAKLGKLIGRELITNNIIAVFELIKNSYDAFANKVIIEFSKFDIDSTKLKSESGELWSIEQIERALDQELEKKRKIIISRAESKITISDDGNGMSLHEIKTKWMEIGTDSKAGISEAHSKRNGRNIVRIINGEKGIGRFGTDKIGSLLLMTSVDSSGSEKSTLSIDWNKLDNHDVTLQEVLFDGAVETFEPNTLPSGLVLEISNLRDGWTGGDILNLKKQLKKMVSPFSQEQDEFAIELKFDNYCIPIVNDSLDNAPISIEGDLSKNGDFTYSIVDNGKRNNDLIHCLAPTFGPIKIKILYMDASSKKSFAKKYGVSVREYGNIKVFRDNFRILPYGEVENDWLGIDNKHAQAVFRSLGTRDIIGYIQITKKDNPQLKDATNRQGLNEDTDQFRSFKDFIWQVLDVFQTYIFEKIKRDAEKQGAIIGHTVIDLKTELDAFSNNLISLLPSYGISEEQVKEIERRTDSSLENIRKNVKKVDSANKQLAQRMVVMEKMVGTESMLYDILHAIKNNMDTLKTAIRDIELQAEYREIEINSEFSNRAIDEITTMVAAALKRTATASKTKEVVDLGVFINNFINEKSLVYKNIEFVTKNITYPRILCNVSGLRTMFDNLLSNSIKALRSSTEKMITISMDVHDNKVTVYFEDSGSGIPDEYVPFIFNVSFSRTGGTGLGLASAYQFMKDNKGTIAYVKNDTAGASFMMEFSTH